MRRISLHRFENDEYSLIDEENEQVMHSSIGAANEARLLYGLPGARHLHALRKPSAVIWDVGSGTGSNATALLDALATSASPFLREIDILSFEAHAETLRKTLEHVDHFPALGPHVAHLRRLEAVHETSGTVGEIRFRWKLHLGDFRETHELAALPDLVFYDFYDPKRVPELWSAPLFAALHRRLPVGATTKLLTYTSAKWVRVNLSAAGFYIGDGTPTKHKHETTEAATSPEWLDHPFPPSWSQRIRDAGGDRVLPAAREKALSHPQWIP